jgi:hypothetical protein
MSVLFSNCESINRDPTNCSSSKQLFSFSKTKRFEGSTSKTEFKYEISRTIAKSKPWSHLKTTFGVMRPELFRDKEKDLKPTGAHYSLPSVFDEAAKPIRRPISVNSHTRRSRNILDPQTSGTTAPV